MQTVERALGVELFETWCTALLVLGHQVEGSQTLELHLLRLEQHLNDTCLCLGEHTLNHVLGEYRSVLRDVLRQLTGVECLCVNDSTVELTISRTCLVLCPFSLVLGSCFSLILQLCCKGTNNFRNYQIFQQLFSENLQISFILRTAISDTWKFWLAARQQ